ncbi:MAG: XRE family transcriptional regulator [Bacteriovoracaceae bacterium]|jgi:predicted XRE-type DNA-binding protein|nr:XRE family transcriptional regulator [Bacteriovoracaceae bacterium]|tara:strand:+ start:310 stop:600 length:291 start_codon:yes stop_codon:yes gene_type:complete
MKSKTYNSASGLAESLGLSRERGLVAEMKAKLTKEIIKAISKEELTHKEVADLSGVPRSAVTGIINGSLQKVSIDRLIRILGTLGKTVELKVKKAA